MGCFFWWGRGWSIVQTISLANGYLGTLLSQSLKEVLVSLHSVKYRVTRLPVEFVGCLARADKSLKYL